ncbi:hypothetical protein D9757_002520 [Collybiopsis confluens]|uniref:Uncharacterized protein n=1 Tax=Collybiopsis confluens TaxID=2823264 RepID=A0A8H5HY45_9AGAR|nr:hypothetical protein D9757_002520 [Collybiopsis confluens]
MLFGKPKLPINWPSPLHNKCSRNGCMYPNLPQYAPGTYTCVGCARGTYVVTTQMAAEADAQARRAYEFREQNRRKHQAIQTANERKRQERDYTRYQREDKTTTRREKWSDRPGSPLGRSPATKRPGSPVARPPLQSTLAVLSPPPPIIAPQQSSSKPKSHHKQLKPPKPLKVSTSKSTPSRPKSPKFTVPRPLSPRNVFAALRGGSPEPPPWYPPGYVPPKRHELNYQPKIKPMCGRNCPIHSMPKEEKPKGPARPPRPPTISLSIHSRDSREEVPVPIMTDASYYAAQAQLAFRGYMPRTIPEHGGTF